METDPRFSDWLLQQIWPNMIAFCKILAVLVPASALVTDVPILVAGVQSQYPELIWIAGFHFFTFLTSVAYVAMDRYFPRLRGNEHAVYILCILIVFFATWMGVCTWFFDHDLSIWTIGLVVVATVICTPRPIRRPYYFLSAGIIVGIIVLNTNGLVPTIVLSINPIAVAIVCLQLDKYTYDHNVELFAQEMRGDYEKARADSVLYNVFPAPIADELKRENAVKAVKFDNMGVMFADLVGFTSYSRSLPPDALVLILNEIFSRFDDLVDGHDLEKIKTIGDAYMVASFDNTASLAKAALRFIDAVRHYNCSNGTEFQMRIGIHVGPAVAGVIGLKRFVYDVWGDTVNVASRMESYGEAGRIHVSKAVREQLQFSFAFTERTPMEIRGRGTMQTYFLGEELPT